MVSVLGATGLETRLLVIVVLVIMLVLTQKSYAGLTVENLLKDGESCLGSFP